MRRSRRRRSVLPVLLAVFAITLLLAAATAILLSSATRTTVSPRKQVMPQRHADERAETDTASEASKAQPVGEPFEASDATGHLVSRGYRIRVLDGNYARTGKWVFFYPDGVTQAEGEFANDARVGRWTSYFPDGTKESEGEFANGLKVGRWTFYTEHMGLSLGKRPIDTQKDYVDDKVVYRIGFHFKPRNIPAGEGPVRNGKPVGESTVYYTTGERKAVQFRRDDGALLSWTMYRKEGEAFASFKDEQYVLRGALQPQLPRKYLGHHRYERRAETAWQHAIRHIWAEEGK